MLQLSSISEWADRKTAAVYLVDSKKKAQAAIDDMFAPNVKATINGRVIDKKEIDMLLLAMRPSEEGALGFYWTDFVGAPRDSSNRVSVRVFGT